MQEISELFEEHHKRWNKIGQLCGLNLHSPPPTGTRSSFDGHFPLPVHSQRLPELTNSPTSSTSSTTSNISSSRQAGVLANKPPPPYRLHKRGSAAVLSSSTVTHATLLSQTKKHSSSYDFFALPTHKEEVADRTSTAPADLFSSSSVASQPSSSLPQSGPQAAFRSEDNLAQSDREGSVESSRGTASARVKSVKASKSKTLRTVSTERTEIHSSEV